MAKKPSLEGMPKGRAQHGQTPLVICNTYFPSARSWFKSSRKNFVAHQVKTKIESVGPCAGPRPSVTRGPGKLAWQSDPQENNSGVTISVRRNRCVGQGLVERGAKGDHFKTRGRVSEVRSVGCGLRVELLSIVHVFPATARLGAMEDAVRL